MTQLKEKIMKKKTVIASLLLLFISINSLTLQAQEYGDLIMPSKIEVLYQYHHNPFQIRSQASTRYVIEPTVGYIYTIGQLEQQELLEAHNVIKMTRRLVGLPGDVQMDEQLNLTAQYASYINMLNATISHYPSKPNLVSDEAYAIGKEGSAKSNLAAGFRTISDSILWGYLQDDDIYNLADVGHRRWLLNPQLQNIGFGYVDTLVDSSYNGFTATYVFDRSRKETIDYPFIAWPAAGNMPVEFMKTSTPWSINLGVEYEQPIKENIRIELTHAQSGKVYRFDAETNSDPSEASNTDFFTTENSRYGLEKTLIFRPKLDEVKYAPGDLFYVEVLGIDIKGEEVPISYEVKLFELNDQPSVWAFEELVEADKANLIPEMLMEAYSEDISRIDFTRLLIHGLMQYTGQTYNELYETVDVVDTEFKDTTDLDVQLAARLGIVNGVGDNRFNPTGGILRQEAATMLYRAGQYLEIEAVQDVQEFSDADKIPDWAKASVDYVTNITDATQGKKVMEGVGNQMFAPDRSYTREQAMITVKRLLNRS